MKTRELFGQQGYIIVPAVYHEAELKSIRQAIAADSVPAEIVWNKDLCACSRNFLNFATHPSIMAPVRELLGGQILLWGGCHLVRRPGEVHHWHTDIESSRPEGGFVTVWIGLEGTNQASALKLVPHSHEFGKTLQEVMQGKGKERKTTTDSDVVRWSSELHQGHQGLEQPDIRNGDAIFFDGRLWHGSNNQNGDLTRTALLFQFVRADVPVRIPDFKFLDWPFSFSEQPEPPCIVASGKCEDSPNTIAEKPPILDDGLSMLECAVHRIDTEKTPDDNRVFQSHRLFQGKSDNLLRMHCHYSTLMPGASPHPPHAHVDEEILVLLRGRANLRYADDDGRVTDHPVEAGQVVYYPSFHRHTIQNDGTEPITYLMFKWVGSGSGAERALSLKSFRVEALGEGPKTERKYSTQRCLHGVTHQLQGIEAHVSTVLPGGGYASHRDEHDIALLVFEGRVEAGGRTLAPGDLLWLPAGTDHDMQNPTGEPARYFVIEFHGDNCPDAYVSFSAPEAKQGRSLFKKRSPQRILRNMLKVIGLK